jgi:hypothetical protein
MVALGAVLAPVAVASPPEFSPPFPNSFTSTSKATTLETVSLLKVKCKADVGNGEVTGPSSAVVTFTFTGCTSGRAKCQNGGLPGEIVSARLSGTLGYINKMPKVVGLDLAEPTGGPMASFFCGEDVRLEVFGSAIGKLKPINKSIKAGEQATLAFAQKEGHQAVHMFLGGPVDVPQVSVLGGPLEEAGIASTDKLAFAAPVTIIA